MKSIGFRPFIIAIFVLTAGVAIKFFLDSQSGNVQSKNLTQKTQSFLEKKSPKLKEIIQNNLEKAEAKAGGNFPLPPGQTMLTRERIYTQDEIDNMTEEKFSEMLSDVERRLPKKSDIKDIPAQALHHTPGLVIEAGRNLGAIKEVLKVHNTYEKIAVPFYERCSKNNEGTTTVRALCLTNLIFINKKNGEPMNMKNYPEEIVKLSKLVTDL